MPLRLFQHRVSVILLRLLILVPLFASAHQSSSTLLSQESRSNQYAPDKLSPSGGRPQSTGRITAPNIGRWILDTIHEVTSSGGDFPQKGALLPGTVTYKKKTAAAYLVMHCDFPTKDYPGLLPLEIILTPESTPQEMVDNPLAAPVDVSDFAQSQIGGATPIDVNAIGQNFTNGARYRFFYDPLDLSAIVSSGGQPLKVYLKAGTLPEVMDPMFQFLLPVDAGPVKQMMSTCLTNSATLDGAAPVSQPNARSTNSQAVENSAQSGSNNMGGDWRSEYSAIKKTYQEFEPPHPELAAEISNSKRDGINLYQCESATNYLDSQSSIAPISDLLDLAGRIVEWRYTLQASGYPEVVWRPLLVQFEDEQLNAVKKYNKIPNEGQAYDRFGEHLAKLLNEYANQHPGSLPRVTYSSECGGIGEQPVKFSTIPPGGAISIIPQFLYKVCEVRQIDPDNPRKCDGWHDVVSDVEKISGGYEYFIRWPDGRTRQGRIDASKLVGKNIRISAER